MYFYLFLVYAVSPKYANAAGEGEVSCGDESRNKSVRGVVFIGVGGSGGMRGVDPVCQDGAEEGARGFSERIGCLVSLIYLFPSRL